MAPFSKMDFEIAKTLADEGYIKSVEKKTFNKKHFLEVKLKYKNDATTFTDFKIISKPSRHMYKKAADLKPVKNSYGRAVLSTPRGIMTNVKARKENVGGEYLFEVW